LITTECVCRELIQRPYLSDLDPWFELALDADMLKKQRKNTTLLQRATTLVRSATMSQVHPTARSHAADYQQTSDGASTATDSMDSEEMEVWQQFRKELLKHFPTFEDQMEARMTPNLVDSTGLSGRDGGLFTGETLLHIAIVQHRNETVAWLLEGGAAIDSRAGGVFFQPQLFETFGVSRCVREYWVRILQDMKSCRLSAPRWHESPSPTAPPGGPPRILQNTTRECSCYEQLHSRVSRFFA